MSEFFQATDRTEAATFLWTSDLDRAGEEDWLAKFNFPIVESVGPISVSEVPFRDRRHSEQSLHQVQLSFEDGPAGFLFLRDTPSGHKIDWAASSAYSDIPFPLLLVEPIPYSRMLRCYATRGNYFRGSYFGLERAYDNYCLRPDDSSSGDRIEAYIARDTPSGTKMRSLFNSRPGETLRVMVRVYTGGLDRQGTDLTIDEFLQEGWFAGIEL